MDKVFNKYWLIWMGSERKYVTTKNYMNVLGSEEDKVMAKVNFREITTLWKQFT